jgi:hypothetical protein
MLCTHQILFGRSSQEEYEGWDMENRRGVNIVSIERLLGRPRHRWEDNIKINL